MSDNESANLISEIQKLASAIVEKSSSGTKPAEFDELVGAYYVVLKGVATELNITENVNDSEITVESIQTLTNQIVDKLKESSDTDKKKTIPQEKLQALLDFFVKYKEALSDTVIGADTTGLTIGTELANKDDNNINKNSSDDNNINKNLSDDNTISKGGRRRTRKNKRRITKRKLNKNKNNGKTKKH